MAGSRNQNLNAIVQHSNYSLGYYWKKLCYTSNDAQRYPLLQVILGKTKSTSSHLITPEYMQTILKLLRDDHSDEVKILILRIICWLELPIVTMLAKNGLLDTVKSLFKIDTPLDSSPGGKMKYHLLCEVINFILQISEKNLSLILKCRMHQGLIMLLDQNDGNVFRYSADCVEAFRSTTDKDLIGLIKEVNFTDKSVCHSYFRANDLQYIVLPKKLYEVSLYDTTDPEKDWDILLELQDKGVVWPQVMESQKLEAGDDGVDNDGDAAVTSPPSNETESATEEDVWKDVTVTCPINGKYFWAHLYEGEKTETDEIREILTNWPERSRQMVTGAPKVGMFVAAPSAEIGMHRAQVIKVKEGRARLFSLDFGIISTSEWKECFLITPDMNLKIYPPQAKLCYLKGSHPPPASPDLLGRALSCLVKLTSNSSLLGMHFHDRPLFRQLTRLVQMPLMDVRSKSALVLANLATSLGVRIDMGQAGIISELVGVMIDLTNKDQSRSLPENDLLRFLLQTMANLLYQCSANKAIFAEETKGLPCLIQLCEDPQFKTHAARVMHVFIGSINLSEAANAKPFPVEEMPRPSYRRSRSNSGERFEGRSYRGRGSFERSRSQGRPRSHSRQRSDGRFAEEGATGRLSMEALNMGDSSEEEEEDLTHSIVHKQQTASTPTESQTVIESQSQDPDTMTYEHGAKFPFKADEKHEFFIHKKLCYVKDEDLAVVIVSLINTWREGSVYVGVTAEGYVQGVPCDRDDREGMRIGVDHLMSDRVSPPLLHNQYQVIFHPVTRKEEKIAHIAELKVKVSQKTFYKTNGKIYVRKGCDILHVTMPNYHAICIEKEEEGYLTKLKMMMLELEKLKERLKDQ